jgi:hypothetical protein
MAEIVVDYENIWEMGSEKGILLLKNRVEGFAWIERESG